MHVLTLSLPLLLGACSSRSMGSRKKGRGLLMCSLLVWLVLQQVVTPAMSRSLEGVSADDKNYYTPNSDSHEGNPHHSHCKTCTSTPSHGDGGSHNPPSAPVISTPPSPSLTPPAPYSVVPTPPATPTIPDPNSPPFTCDYWRTHPGAILALFGYFCTLGQFFGLPAASAFGTNPSLVEALSNTRSDGIGALYREGTASFLNSLVNNNFDFTTQQVRDAFNAAVVSEEAATTQAKLFKMANENRHVKHH